MSDGEVVVQVEGLIKEFRTGLGFRRKRILDGVDFEVRRGEVFGFIGPNGAGKTTTLKILMGLVKATAGRARIMDCSVDETSFHRQIGFSPESPCFYDFLTGHETLSFYARLCGLPDAVREEAVDRVLAEVGLAHAGDARLRTYSKGMLQRISIAQALVHDPDVLFLDEPMSGLDPVGRKEVRDLIAGLNERGKTILMCTHILSDVESLCDRVAIIVEGAIGYEGSIEGLLPERERSVDLCCTGLPPEYAEELAGQAGCELLGQGDRITLRVPEKNANEVLRAVLARDAQVLELAPRRLGLEDVFLHVVEGAAGKEGAS